MCYYKKSLLRKHVKPSSASMKIILSRLPTKSLLRFRFACKSWYSLINESGFAELQLRNGPDKNKRGLLTLLQTQYASEIYLYRFADNMSFHRIFRLGIKNEQNLQAVSNSFNGLVCFFMDEDVIVVNPSTKEFVVLPSSTHDESVSKPFGGLGFDTLTGNYKVLRMYSYECKDVLACEIFSLGSNSWRRIEDAPCSIMCQRPLFIDGVLFWSNTKRGVLAFNVQNEVFSTIPFPERKWRERTFIIAELAGSLFVAASKPDNSKMDLYIWKCPLKEGSCWFLLHKINLQRVERWSTFYRWMPVLRWGEKILLTNYYNRLDCYDTRSGLVRNICNFRSPCWPNLFSGVIHVESLVSPCGIQGTGVKDCYANPSYASLECQREVSVKNGCVSLGDEDEFDGYEESCRDTTSQKERDNVLLKNIISRVGLVACAFSVLLYLGKAR